MGIRTFEISPERTQGIPLLERWIEEEGGLTKTEKWEKQKKRLLQKSMSKKVSSSIS